MKIEMEISTLKAEYKEILQSLQWRLENYCKTNESFSNVFNNLVVERMIDSPPLEFIKKFFPSTDVWLFYTRFENTCSTPLDSDHSKREVFFDNHSMEESKMDLTGQPLECPFDLSEIKASIDFTQNATRLRKISENKYEPSPISVARMILNNISSIILENNRHETLSTPSFCVLCDAKDRNKTCIIGCHFSKNKSVFTFTVQLVEGTVSNGIPSLSQIVNQKNCSYPLLNSEILESSFSFYDFTNGPSSIIVQCNWEESKELLTIPPKEATCNLRVRLAQGEISSPLYSRYQELTLLRNAVTAIETGEMIWPLEEKENELNAIEKVKELINATSVYQSTIGKKDRLSAAEGTQDYESFCLEKLFISNQANGDFVTQLWSALRNCQSMNDLEEVLRLVCSSVSNSELFPHVNRKNQTQLAIWIQKTLEGVQLNPLNTKGISALIILVEIGNEKLWNDYCAAFFGLTTLELLNDYYQPPSAGLSSCVDSLFKIHYALDFVVFCQYSLGIEDFNLTRLTGQVLKETAKEDFLADEELIMSIELTAVLPALNRSNPDKWELNYKVTESKQFSRQIFCQLSQNRIVPQNWCSIVETIDVTAKTEINNETKVGDKIKYYGIVVKASELGA